MAESIENLQYFSFQSRTLEEPKSVTMELQFNGRIFLFIQIFLVGLSLSSCKSQVESVDKIVGGAFESRDFLYIGMPENIHSIDTSQGWNQTGERILITGKIYQKDGQTPAPGVILYYYHTDINGLYSSNPQLDKRVLRHGYIRGWVQSDSAGKYSIYTVKPAPYPGLNEPAHIHPVIKEPGYIAYWIDEFVFEGDPLLTAQKRERLRSRGGSGILSIVEEEGILVARHDIVLGENIPGY